MRLFLLLFCMLTVNIIHAKTVDEEFMDKVLLGPPEWAKEQVIDDFKTISASDITPERLDAAMAEERLGDLLLVRYCIRDGQIVVHSTTPGAQKMNRLPRLNQHLEELARLCQNDLKLPDCEFIVSLHDSFAEAEELNTAVFSFAKNKFTPKVILIPDTDVLADADSLQEQVLVGNKLYPWESKKEVAFWRGVTTGGLFTFKNYKTFPRFQLVGLSIEYPKKVDAKFTNFCQGAEKFEKKLVGYSGKSMGISDHLKYKYQILVDGNSCAYSRAYWQLFSNSVILKQTSDNIQWYYKGLKPNEHYVPVASDFHDLIETVNWAKKHDRKVRKINANAQSFAHENLLRADLYHYLYLVITHYAQLQKELQK